MKLALAQMQMSDDREQNLEKSLRMIREAAEAGADLIVFPEIQLSPFFPQYAGRDVSTYVLTEESAEVRAVCEACRDARVFAAPNFYLGYNGKRYDTSLLIDREGRIVGLIPTANTSAEPSELFQWEIKIQAFQNSVFIAMCNRVGPEDGMQFSGESIVCGPDGATLAIAGAEECLLLCELDLLRARALRAEKPYTQLRRTDCYE